MSTTGRTPVANERPRGPLGYSLVEIIVAVAVASIVGLGIFAVFSASRKSGISAKIYNDMQTDCNFAMDKMKAELLLAGYHARNQERPISFADSNTVTFEFYDDNARDEAPYANGYLKNTKVTYSLVAGELIRSYQRWSVASGNWDGPNTSQTLAKNIAAVSFDYLASGGAAWDGADTADIRSVRTSLTCDASRPDPNTGKTPRLTLTAEVRARNAGVASTPADVTPPAAPTNLIAWDPGSCGMLQLQWTGVADTDLAGYTIFYGLTSGNYTDRIVISRDSNAGGTETYTLSGLSSAVTGVYPQPRYYITLYAYDKSGNVSADHSNEVSGNPPITVAEPTGCDDSACAASTPDTTPTPLTPDAPVNLTATAGTNSITLAWTKSTSADLIGYRLYRGTTADFTPSDEVPTNRIADEFVLTVDTTTYTNSSLIGCQPYYYKLAAIACDSNIPIAYMQFASAPAAPPAAPVVPTDTVQPGAPKITARPGYKRIILTLTNPSDADFSHTKIFWNQSTAASPAAIPTTASPLLPDTDISPYSSVNAGTFEASGTQTVNFNDATNGSPGYTVPNLDACAAGSTPENCLPITYQFTAVAYDLCGNASQFSDDSTTDAEQCADCVDGELCYGAPYWGGGAPGGSATMGTSHLTAAACSSDITLTWDAISSTDQKDLAGFHVYRCEASTCADGFGTRLTSDPVWDPYFLDTSVNQGTTYSYRVQAVDCYYERFPSTSGNYTYDSINNLSIGGVSADQTMSHPATGYLLPNTQAIPFTVIAADGLTPVPPDFQHNTVTTWVNNTANAVLTLTQARFSWGNTNDYLQQFSFGDGDSTYVTREGWVDTVLPLTVASTGNTVTLHTNSSLLPLDSRIPIVLKFKNADGTVTPATDARAQSIHYDLTYRNESTQTAGCVLTGDFYVPRGPYVYGTTQDQPSAGTISWPVPGSSGTNAKNTISAQGGTGVTVYTNVFDTAGDGIASVKLYYYVDATRALNAAPTVTTQYPNFTPTYPAAIDMELVAGTQWRTPLAQPIPSADGKNVWFFIVALDTHGNFDREPEIGYGSFQYYQQPADACQTTPRAPTLCPADAPCTSSGTTVVLNWTAPIANTNGTSYIDPKGYRVYRSKDLGTWALVQTITDKNTLTWTTTLADLASASYRFTVLAYDTCSPTAKISGASNYYTDTVEGDCSNIPNAPALSGTTNGNVGFTDGTVTLTWVAPPKNTSGTDCTDLAGYRIYRQIGSGASDLYVPGAGGSFSGPGGSLPPGTLTWTDPPTGTIPDLLAEDYQYRIVAIDSCSTGENVSPTSPPYIDEFTALIACNTIPGNVTGFTGSVDSSTRYVTLTWVAPTTQSTPLGTPYNDPGGFYIARFKDGVFQTTITLSYPSDTSWTDSSVAGDIGTSTYRYVIRAKDTCVPTPKYSPSYPSWQESFSDACASINPPPPTLTAFTLADNTGITVNWSNPSPLPADMTGGGYVVERNDPNTGTWAELPSPLSPLYYPVNSVRDNTIKPAEGEYCYRLKTFDSCPAASGGPNYGPYSAESCEGYNPCGTQPDPPTMGTGSVGLAGTINAGIVTVSWTPPSTTASNNQGLTGYKIYRERKKDASSDPSCGWELVNTVTNPTTTFWDDTSVVGYVGSRRYSYKITSYKTCGTLTTESATASGEWAETYSGALCNNIPAPAPSPFTVVADPSCTTTEQTAKLSFSTASKNPTTGGATITFDRYYSGGSAIYCDTLGCFSDAGMCTSATKLSSLNSNGTTSYVSTVEMPSYLKANAYTFGVQQVEVKSGCRTVSPAATATDTCN